LLFSLGDPLFRTFARSVLKPFQLVGVIESGTADHFSFSGRELEIMAGSHSGSASHLEVVRGILSKIGLDETALECGAHIPRDPEQSGLISLGKLQLCQLHNNCSGKNSGMLSICVKNGWDHRNYRSLSHNVQQYILGKVREILELPPLDDLAFAIDGCGVPTPHLELKTLAMGFARLAIAEGNSAAQNLPCASSLQRVREAMTAYPEMVAGGGRVCTAIIRSTRGRIIAKGGGEGIYCIADVKSGIAACLKIEDGSPRAVAPAAIEVMRQLGFLDERQLEELKDFRTTAVTNHSGAIVGRVAPRFELERCN